MKLIIEIESTEKGPVLQSWYGEKKDTSYRPAKSNEDLNKMVIEVVSEWIKVIKYPNAMLTGPKVTRNNLKARKH